MGEGLIKFYKEKIKKEYKIAFFVTFVVTLLIHIYKFTNNLPNQDSIFNYYHDQNILYSGRWFLSLACGIGSYFDLPWINGFLSCVYISLTAVVLVAIFKIKNPIAIFLIGGLLASSPATTETFQFEYTADGYMLAMLLATLAVYLARIEEKRISRIIISIILISLSCASYQAYIPYALMLVLCQFIEILINNKHKLNDSLKWLGRQFIIYFISLIFYYVIWKILLSVFEVEATSYYGISNFGNISFDLIKNGIFGVVKTFYYYFFQYAFIGKNSINTYNVLNIIFTLFMVCIFISISIKEKFYKRKATFILYFLAIIMFIPCGSMIHFVSDISFGNYFARMLQGYTILFVFVTILFEKWGKSLSKNAFAVLILIIIFNNALMANISYYCMDLSYERTYGEALEMMIRINEVTDGKENINEMVVVGNKVREAEYRYYDFEKNDVTTTGSLDIVMRMAKKTLLFDPDHVRLFLANTFDLQYYMSWDQNYRDSFLDRSDVQKMGVWPAKDSIAIIDDKLIIKISNTKESEI